MKKFTFFILFTLFTAIPLYSEELSSETPQTPADPDVKKSETMLGFGAGMSIGSVPLFTLWQNSLPDSISRIGLTPDFGRETDALSGSLVNLRYVITEAPEVFNLIFPLTLSVYNMKNDRIATLGLSFFYTSKQFQSMIHPELDTLSRRVNIDQKLSLYSLSLEAGYQKAIPPAYFSITGSQQTLFSVSLAASPYNMFTRNSKIRTSVSESDMRMRAAADSARKSLSDLSSHGKALSWRLGFTTLKHYGDGGGVEMGLFYGGSYNALFYDDSYALFYNNKGSRTRKSQIYTAEDEKDKNLTFLQSKIELRITFLRSLKRGKTTADSSHNDINDEIE